MRKAYAGWISVLCVLIGGIGCSDDSAGPAGPATPADVMGIWLGAIDAGQLRLAVEAEFGPGPDSVMTLSVDMDIDTTPPPPVYRGFGTYSVRGDTVFAQQELCILYDFDTFEPDTITCTDDAARVDGNTIYLTYHFPYGDGTIPIPVTLTRQTQ